MAQLTTDDNKTVQYITQPAFGYNYALVNQMQLAQNGVTGITVDGRQLVVNKPITTNTISNISFKCDVCGLMFAHLTLLNHHKRSHSQDGSDSQNDAITVVTQPQGIVQGQNIITENGQNLGQIQIVATESLDPQQTQTIQEVTITQNNKIDKTQKCITCGGSIVQNPKRKGPKLIRCELCISNDSNVHISRRKYQYY